MELSSKFLQCLLIVVISVYTVESVLCYHCNSGKGYNGADCESSNPDVLKKFVYDCSRGVYINAPVVNCTHGNNYTHDDNYTRGDKYTHEDNTPGDNCTRGQYTHDGYNYTHCRKAFQTVGDDKRTIRTCATGATENETESKCTYRTGTKSVSVKYCDCYKESCNGSSGFIASILLVFGLALSNAFANTSYDYLRRTVA